MPARVVTTPDDAVSALKAELQENACRLDLKPTEIADLGKRIEAVEKPEAKGRQKDGGSAGGKGCGKLPRAPGEKSRDKVGKALGVSGKTYDKIAKIREAAEADPDKYGDLLQLMNDQSVESAVWVP